MRLATDRDSLRSKSQSLRSPSRGKLSLQERAYHEIRRQIITLRLKPGEYINVDALCTVLGIGRTPVQLALKRLMHESLVSILPRKGVLVSPIFLNEIMEVIDVRMVTEVYSVRLAAERTSFKKIDLLTDLLKEGDSFIAANHLEGLMNIDHSFHRIISDMSGNKVLAETLEALHIRSLRFWFISLSNEKHMREAQEEHWAILRAVANRDPDAAVDATISHISGFRANIARSGW